MRLAVVLSTFNAPERLEPTLAGYAVQTTRDFELIVADDGSTDETRRLIERHSQRSQQQIKHVWHEDRGFRKCRILNQAILATHADYMIFSDGDCIPRRDFVAQHLRLARRGRFLSGGYIKLNQAATHRIHSAEVTSGNALHVEWLAAAGMKQSGKLRRLALPDWQARMLNAITPTRATWNGHNSSGWRSDLLRINGFDERMQYWAQDREFGERLQNAGVRGMQIRYSALCVHLEHERPYKNDASRERNQQIRNDTRRHRASWTAHGILKCEGYNVLPQGKQIERDVLIRQFGL